MSKNEGIEPGATVHKGRVSPNSGAARQLSGLLPGYGLEKLSDEEAVRLIEFINFLDSEAAEEGFREGWNCGRAFAECDYNGHGAALLEAGPSTEH